MVRTHCTGYRSHNAPVIKPNSKYKGGPLTPAFNSLDMVEIIGTHQPALWVFGHTHECDDPDDRPGPDAISNQLGCIPAALRRF